MKNKIIITFLTALLLWICAPFAGAVDDNPAPPPVFWGSVEFNGQPVLTGSVVPIIDGQAYTMAPINNGYYGEPERLEIRGSNLSGKTIYFQVNNGTKTVMAEETAVWDYMGVTQLDLHAFDETAQPPVFQSISVDERNHVVTIVFDRNLDEISPDLLKNNLQIKRQGQVSFISLDPEDSAIIQGNSIIVTFNHSLVGENNQLQIANTVLWSSGRQAAQNLTETIPVEGCFIATAAYGSYLDPHVWVLRNFRDNILLKTSWGTWFVKQYYRYSPPVADYIADSSALRLIVRLILTPLVYMVEYTWLSMALIIGIAICLIMRRREPTRV